MSGEEGIAQRNELACQNEHLRSELTLSREARAKVEEERDRLRLSRKEISAELGGALDDSRATIAALREEGKALWGSVRHVFANLRPFNGEECPHAFTYWTDCKLCRREHDAALEYLGRLTFASAPDTATPMGDAEFTRTFGPTPAPAPVTSAASLMPAWCKCGRNKLSVGVLSSANVDGSDRHGRDWCNTPPAPAKPAAELERCAHGVSFAHVNCSACKANAPAAPQDEALALVKAWHVFAEGADIGMGPSVNDIIERQLTDIRAALAAARREGAEAAARVVAGWHISKGGYTELAHTIRALDLAALQEGKS